MPMVGSAGSRNIANSGPRSICGTVGDRTAVGIHMILSATCTRLTPSTMPEVALYSTFDATHASIAKWIFCGLVVVDNVLDNARTSVGEVQSFRVTFHGDNVCLSSA